MSGAIAVSSVGVALENGGADIIVRWQIMIDAVSPARRVAGARLGGKEGSRRLRCSNGFIMVVTHGGAVEACSLSRGTDANPRAHRTCACQTCSRHRLEEFNPELKYTLLNIYSCETIISII